MMMIDILGEMTLKKNGSKQSNHMLRCLDTGFGYTVFSLEQIYLMNCPLLRAPKKRFKLRFGDTSNKDWCKRRFHAEEEHVEKASNEDVQLDV